MNIEFRRAGYYMGVNADEAAGQTVPDAYQHVTPRYPGDVETAWGCPARDTEPAAPETEEVVQIAEQS